MRHLSKTWPLTSGNTAKLIWPSAVLLWSDCLFKLCPLPRGPVVSASHQNKYPESQRHWYCCCCCCGHCTMIFGSSYSFDILIFDVLKVQYSARSIEWQVRVGRDGVKTGTQCHNDAFCGAKHQFYPAAWRGGDADNAATHWHEMSQLNIHIWLFCDETQRNIAGVPSPVHIVLPGSGYSAVFTLWWCLNS